MKKLVIGTEKQIEWAEKIRIRFFENINEDQDMIEEMLEDEEITQETIDNRIEFLKNIDSAIFWINYKSYNLFVFLSKVDVKGKKLVW